MPSSRSHRLAAFGCLIAILALWVLRLSVIHDTSGTSVAVRSGEIAFGYGLTEIICGNAKLEAGEECDDGNSVNTDKCTAKCYSARCGDGYIQPGEQCDPPGQGLCSAFCVNATSASAASSSSRSSLRNHCGNNVPEPTKGEECDLGTRNGISPLCSIDCKKTYCGDGVRGPGEDCEPQRTASGTFVTPACGLICEAPDCSSGQCIGGCRQKFLPACTQSSSSVSVADSSIVTTGSSSSPLLPFNPFSQAVAIASSKPASSASALSASSAAMASSSAASSDVAIPQSREGAPETSPPEEERCGNGRLEGIESCDDGNALDGDGCSMSCVLELPTLWHCGNAIVEGDEACDEGALNSDVLPDTCRTYCRLPRCGDGVRDAAEQCDDGNETPGDACNPSCLLSVCGNGVLETGEECDDGARNSDVSPDACRLNCHIPRCGDGLIDAAFGEQCDTADERSNLVPDACRMDCRAAWCGDGVSDAGEQCDDANDISDDGCDRCVFKRCSDGAPIQEGGGCLAHAAASLCIGDDCVTAAPEPVPFPSLLLLLLSLELAAVVLFWVRLRTNRRLAARVF
jgi:cysteine-rich repeat protein